MLVRGYPDSYYSITIAIPVTFSIRFSMNRRIIHCPLLQVTPHTQFVDSRTDDQTYQELVLFDSFTTYTYYSARGSLLSHFIPGILMPIGDAPRAVCGICCRVVNYPSNVTISINNSGSGSSSRRSRSSSSAYCLALGHC